MRLFHILLLPLCLLLAQVGPGAGLIKRLSIRNLDYRCPSWRGICTFGICPPDTSHIGSCQNGRAKCCI
ncbi:unnamed protein product [Pipistrellus nathusii]|uniref:Beta-defensin 1 n=1 Tax=Pipistrellus nathusii TaxID=59473 RepID=A0ABN9ZZH4_PIPNA